jgi:hypothetical protein
MTRRSPFTLDEYDAWCVDAGLRLDARFSTWSGDPFDASGGYAVTLHRHAT